MDNRENCAEDGHGHAKPYKAVGHLRKTGPNNMKY